MTRVRIAAIIINDEKLLLLNGHDSKEFWTPGGKREEGETDIECLRRELKEELDVDLVSAEFFKEYHGKSFYNPEIDTVQRVYISKIKNILSPSAEIHKLKWLSKEEFYSKEYADIAITQEREDIIPDIIKSGVW